MNERQRKAPLPEQPRDVAAEVLRVVTAMVEETRPGRVGRVSMNSHLERDLGLDSLARVELLLRLGKEFGRSLPDGALAEAETPQDLLCFLAGAGDAVAARNAVTATGGVSTHRRGQHAGRADQHSWPGGDAD